MVRPERGSQSNQGDFNNTLTSIRVPKSSQPPILTTVSSQAKPLVKPTVSDTTQHITSNPVQPVVKPTMISSTDLVGQILLQGYEQSSSGLSRNRENTVPVKKPAQPTNKRCQAVNVMNDTIKETKKTTVPRSETSTIKTRAAPSSVSWDMNKLLTPNATDAERIPCDLLVEQAQADIKAKRQRLSQWLSVSIREYKF